MQTHIVKFSVEKEYRESSEKKNIWFGRHGFSSKYQNSNRFIHAMRIVGRHFYFGLVPVVKKTQKSQTIFPFSMCFVLNLFI